MSRLQRFVLALAPKRWAADMEAESRTWLARCECGHELSIWEHGGIRWKAKGTPTRVMACPTCGKRTPHKIYRKPTGATP